MGVDDGLVLAVFGVWSGLRWSACESGVGGTGMAHSVECVDVVHC